MRKDDMTPEVRIDRNLLRIFHSAGIPITHCTEEQLAVMREEMRSIMKESYIKGSNIRSLQTYYNETAESMARLL